jgi:hypothetical protein
MTTSEKLQKIFDCGWFQIYNSPRHISGGDWEDRIYWRNVGMPGSTYIKDSKGFTDIDACLDDCLKYCDKIIADQKLEKEAEKVRHLAFKAHHSNEALHFFDLNDDDGGDEDTNNNI